MAAAGLVWALLLNALGPINYLLVSVGILERAMDFLGDKDTALWGMIVINVWKSYPFYMIMLLGGLQTIPPACMRPPRWMVRTAGIGSPS